MSGEQDEVDQGPWVRGQVAWWGPEAESLGGKSGWKGSLTLVNLTSGLKAHVKASCTSRMDHQLKDIGEGMGLQICEIEKEEEEEGRSSIKDARDEIIIQRERQVSYHWILPKRLEKEEGGLLWGCITFQSSQDPGVSIKFSSALFLDPGLLISSIPIPEEGMKNMKEGMVRPTHLNFDCFGTVVCRDEEEDGGKEHAWVQSGHPERGKVWRASWRDEASHRSFSIWSTFAHHTIQGAFGKKDGCVQKKAEGASVEGDEEAVNWYTPHYRPLLRGDEEWGEEEVYLRVEPPRIALPASGTSLSASSKLTRKINASGYVCLRENASEGNPLEQRGRILQMIYISVAYHPVTFTTSIHVHPSKGCLTRKEGEKEEEEEKREESSVAYTVQVGGDGREDEEGKEDESVVEVEMGNMGHPYGWPRLSFTLTIQHPSPLPGRYQITHPTSISFNRSDVYGSSASEKMALNEGGKDEEAFMTDPMIQCNPGERKVIRGWIIGEDLMSSLPGLVKLPLRVMNLYGSASPVYYSLQVYIHPRILQFDGLGIRRKGSQGSGSETASQISKDEEDEEGEEKKSVSTEEYLDHSSGGLEEGLYLPSSALSPPLETLTGGKDQSGLKMARSNVTKSNEPDLSDKIWTISVTNVHPEGKPLRLLIQAIVNPMLQKSGEPAEKPFPLHLVAYSARGSLEGGAGIVLQPGTSTELCVEACIPAEISGMSDTLPWWRILKGYEEVEVPKEKFLKIGTLKCKVIVEGAKSVETDLPIYGGTREDEEGQRSISEESAGETEESDEDQTEAMQRPRRGSRSSEGSRGKGAMSLSSSPSPLSTLSVGKHRTTGDSGSNFFTPTSGMTDSDSEEYMSDVKSEEEEEGGDGVEEESDVESEGEYEEDDHWDSPMEDTSPIEARKAKARSKKLRTPYLRNISIQLRGCQQLADDLYCIDYGQKDLSNEALLRRVVIEIKSSSEEKEQLDRKEREKDIPIHVCTLSSFRHWSLSSTMDDWARPDRAAEEHTLDAGKGKHANISRSPGNSALLGLDTKEIGTQLRFLLERRTLAPPGHSVHGEMEAGSKGTSTPSSCLLTVMAKPDHLRPLADYILVSARVGQDEVGRGIWNHVYLRVTMEVVTSRNWLFSTASLGRRQGSEGRMFEVWPMNVDNAQEKEKKELNEHPGPVDLGDFQEDRIIVELGEVYLGTVYSARSLLLRNHADLPLAFTLQASCHLTDQASTELLGMDGSDLKFSTSRTTLKQFQYLYVDGQSSGRIYTHFSPRAEKERKEEMHISVACRAIKNFQYTIIYRYQVLRPRMAITADFLSFGKCRGEERSQDASM